MRTSRAPFWSIACGLALRAGAAAGQTLPAVAEPQPPAAPPIAAEPTAAPPETRWYGWQTLAPDAVAVGLALVALHVGEKADQADTAQVLLALGAGIFLADGPIVHALHGQPGRAGWSLALRLGLREPGPRPAARRLLWCPVDAPIRTDADARNRAARRLHVHVHAAAAGNR